MCIRRPHVGRACWNNPAVRIPHHSELRKSADPALVERVRTTLPLEFPIIANYFNSI